MKCVKIIQFGDDFGDNVSTFHCQLKQGHEGRCQEIAHCHGQNYTLTFEGMIDYEVNKVFNGDMDKYIKLSASGEFKGTWEDFCKRNVEAK